MLGCTYGTLFQTTVAGGAYQEGMTIHLQGVPPGLSITEEEIYGDLLLRKPGQGELSSPLPLCRRSLRGASAAYCRTEARLTFAGNTPAAIPA